MANIKDKNKSDGKGSVSADADSSKSTDDSTKDAKPDTITLTTTELAKQQEKIRLEGARKVEVQKEQFTKKLEAVATEQATMTAELEAAKAELKAAKAIKETEVKPETEVKADEKADSKPETESKDASTASLTLDDVKALLAEQASTFNKVLEEVELKHDNALKSSKLDSYRKDCIKEAGLEDVFAANVIGGSKEDIDLAVTAAKEAQSTFISRYVEQGEKQAQDQLSQYLPHGGLAPDVAGASTGDGKGFKSSEAMAKAVGDMSEEEFDAFQRKQLEAIH